MISEVMHIYFAELAASGAPNVTEGIEDYRRISKDEFASTALHSEIIDCHTVVGYILARMNNLLP